MQIRVDDLTGADIAALLQEHVDDMRAVSPPDSKHALDLDGLRSAEITFWRLYAKFGFSYCQPFADYQEYPNSVFMTRTL